MGKPVISLEQLLRMYPQLRLPSAREANLPPAEPAARAGEYGAAENAAASTARGEA
ncbi:MAG TPA: hypothetical protein VN028_00120 [Rhodocyclaceae bacterium]|nr:hypothetical protein [Rhodocyclaceae bacterium]